MLLNLFSTLPLRHAQIQRAPFFSFKNITKASFFYVFIFYERAGNLIILLYSNKNVSSEVQYNYKFYNLIKI